jgi:cobalt-zinc-cadmium efflux system outer membrane protein
MAWAVLAACLAASAAGAAQAPAVSAGEPPLALSEALAAARAGNPVLRAARLREPVDQAAVDVAAELPNPELRYERAKDAPRDTIGFAQVIELGGRRARRTDAARAALLTGRAEVAVLEAEVAAQVRRAFGELAAAQRRSTAIAELLDLARRARDAAAARLEAGDVSQLDALQAELPLLQAENEAASQKGTRAAAAAELNALIGRDPAAPTVVVDEVDGERLPDRLAALSATETGNRTLALVEQQIAEAQARAALARALRWPETSVEAGATHGAQPEFDWGYRFSLGVAVPLFTGHGAAVRMEEATLALRRAEREAALQRARGAVVAALARADAQRQRYLRFRDEILPKSRQVEDMAEESYRAGQTPLSALLQALQAARDLRALALDAASEYETALADVEQAISLGGRP